MMMQMLVLLLFTGIFAIVWRQGGIQRGGGQGSGSRSAGLLALGLGLGVVGNTLWVLRGAVSPLLSVVAANLLMHGGTLLVCWAAALLAGRRFPVWIMPPALAADALLFFHFTLIQPDYQVRSILASGLYGVLYLSAGALLLGERRRWRLIAVRCAALPLIGLGLIHAMRVVLVLFQPGGAAEQGEAQRGGLLLLFLILVVAGLVSLLWVHMADAQNALREEVDSRRASEAALARAKEAAERMAATRSRFLANMSHEIRTPMNAVSGLARLLGQSVLNERQRIHVTRIAAAADLLLRLTDGVLSVARLEAGQVALDESDFDLADLLDGVAGAVAPVAEAKGLDFVIDRSDGVPAVLRGDAGRLGQILLNLAGNAVKFTETGSVRLSVEPAMLAGGRRGLRFSVRDSGPGIDPRHLSDIFEPFHQPDAASARRHGGSGLGLAIARQAATLMGGTISADSRPGQGSVFTVILPFGTAAGSTVPQAPPVRLDGMRVLVVDDDEVNREVAREILEQAGALVETALDGREAVAWAIDPASGIDAVLMDIRMPGLDGLAATAFIREQRGLADLPVIAVTAHAYDEERRQCLAAGMNDFVTKPVAPERLLGVLARWLKPRTAAVAASAAAAAASPAGAGLPDSIAGFDIAAAVERFCGNAGLVRHLLDRFAQRCAEAAELLAAPADAGLRPFLHRLRGAAVTLGAERIAGHAERLSRLLEDAPPDGGPPDDGRVEAVLAESAALADALAAAARAIRAAGIGAERPPVAANGKIGEVAA
ncbi:ATP-binding protein [Azospirillum sp. B510]|uniref:ATP-binding protein n=1 Tax=Azospirillum sp. (strain B510) TaxID=137722 RepID=UPI000314C546|nr:ATP-binding protein [Azospirillum sp. B510]